MGRPPLNFEGRGGKLYGDGRVFKVKGINWYGTEHKLDHPPFGLDRHSMDWYFGLLAENGFNAVRFMFNHEAVLKDATVPAKCSYCTKVVDHLRQEPSLAGVSYTTMFLRLAEAAAKHGLLVMLVCHRITTDAGWGAKWYTKEWPLARVKSSWDRVAQVLCGQWNVFAMDLQNEPAEATWGSGNPDDDWALGAAELGNHLLSRCPRWLIMVEGVAGDPGAYDGATRYKGDDAARGMFWGENLRGASKHPVLLSDPTKLVYSPHSCASALLDCSTVAD